MDAAVSLERLLQLKYVVGEPAEDLRLVACRGTLSELELAVVHVFILIHPLLIGNSDINILTIALLCTANGTAFVMTDTEAQHDDALLAKTNRWTLSGLSSMIQLGLLLFCHEFPVVHFWQ